MKTILFSLIVAMLVPAVSHAKVEDFNAMINENAKIQFDLHKKLKTQVKSNRKAVQVTDAFEGDINSTSNKALTTFEKERMYYRASEAKQLNRLANELSATETTY